MVYCCGMAVRKSVNIGGPEVFSDRESKGRDSKGEDVLLGGLPDMTPMESIGSRRSFTQRFRETFGAKKSMTRDSFGVPDQGTIQRSDSPVLLTILDPIERSSLIAAKSGESRTPRTPKELAQFVGNGVAKTTKRAANTTKKAVRFASGTFTSSGTKFIGKFGHLPKKSKSKTTSPASAGAESPTVCVTTMTRSASTPSRGRISAKLFGDIRGRLNERPRSNNRYSKPADLSDLKLPELCFADDDASKYSPISSQGRIRRHGDYTSHRSSFYTAKSREELSDDDSLTPPKTINPVRKREDSIGRLQLKRQISNESLGEASLIIHRSEKGSESQSGCENHSDRQHDTHKRPSVGVKIFNNYASCPSTRGKDTLSNDDSAVSVGKREDRLAANGQECYAGRDRFVSIANEDEEMRTPATDWIAKLEFNDFKGSRLCSSQIDREIIPELQKGANMEKLKDFITKISNHDLAKDIANKLHMKDVKPHCDEVLAYKKEAARIGKPSRGVHKNMHKGQEMDAFPLPTSTALPTAKNLDRKPSSVSERRPSLASLGRRFSRRPSTASKVSNKSVLKSGLKGGSNDKNVFFRCNTAELSGGLQDDGISFRLRSEPGYLETISRMIVDFMCEFHNGPDWVCFNYLKYLVFDVKKAMEHLGKCIVWYHCDVWEYLVGQDTPMLTQPILPELMMDYADKDDVSKNKMHQWFQEQAISLPEKHTENGVSGTHNAVRSKPNASSGAQKVSCGTQTERPNFPVTDARGNIVDKNTPDAREILLQMKRGSPSRKNRSMAFENSVQEHVPVDIDQIEVDSDGRLHGESYLCGESYRCVGDSKGKNTATKASSSRKQKPNSQREAVATLEKKETVATRDVCIGTEHTSFPYCYPIVGRDTPDDIARLLCPLPSNFSPYHVWSPWDRLVQEDAWTCVGACYSFSQSCYRTKNGETVEYFKLHRIVELNSGKEQGRCTNDTDLEMKSGYALMKMRKIQHMKELGCVGSVLLVDCKSCGIMNMSKAVNGGRKNQATIWNLNKIFPGGMVRTLMFNMSSSCTFLVGLATCCWCADDRKRLQTSSGLPSKKQLEEFGITEAMFDSLQKEVEHTAKNAAIQRSAQKAKLL